jgi:hypothetical protein
LLRRRAGQHRIFSQLNDSNGSDAVVEDAVRNTVRCNAWQHSNAPLQRDSASPGADVALPSLALTCRRAVAIAHPRCDRVASAGGAAFRQVAALIGVMATAGVVRSLRGGCVRSHACMRERSCRPAHSEGCAAHRARRSVAGRPNRNAAARCARSSRARAQVPLLCCPRGGAAEAVARMLQKQIKDQLMGKPTCARGALAAAQGHGMDAVHRPAGLGRRWMGREARSRRKVDWMPQ